MQALKVLGVGFTLFWLFGLPGGSRAATNSSPVHAAVTGNVADRIPREPSVSSDAYLPLWKKEPPNIADLALIYQGGLQRPAWTEQRFAPYVTYRDPRSSKEEWLFDGFLFLEFADGRGHTYEPGRDLIPARQTDWLWLLDRNFGPEDGLTQLERACHDAARRIGKPVRRRQVLLTIPTPIPGQTNWGHSNGRKLDFGIQADRLAACDWFLETALARWKALAPQQLDLAGFYWLHESAPRSTEFLQAVAKLVHARNKNFFWIPYWQPIPPGHNWREYGFDAAWQQPNHFFHPELPDSRLRQACDFARQRGMGLEMEFDSRLLSRADVFAPRLEAYLDVFTTNGVADASSIAWYEGGGTFFELADSSLAETRQRYERLAGFILRRQHLADQRSTR